MSEPSVTLPSVHTRRTFLGVMAAGLSATCVAPSVALGVSTAMPSRASVLQSMSTRVDFRYRHAWAEEDPAHRLLKQAATYSRVTIHHTGSSINHHTREADVAYDIEAIRIGHRGRNFGDIGYHFIVDRSGRAWEGRSLQYIGAHVSSENDENIGVMLLGNFERQRPADRQIASLDALIEVVRQRFGIPAYRVYGHRDLGQTLCPGQHLYGHVLHLVQTG